MQMISLQLPDTLAHLFNQVCAGSDAVKNQLFTELVARHIENIEDGVAARLALEESSPPESWKSIDDLAHELHLER